jgi:uncharacterized protein involved in exopolysaccharide biosynthesis
VTIVRAVIATAIIMTAVAFLIPPEYTAEAVILTPQKTQPSFSAVAQLTGLGSGEGLSSLGLLAGLGLRSPSDLYVGILESRTIADGLITKFKLKQVYDDDDFYTARKRLKRRTTIKAGRDTLIHVRVEDRQPRRAAQLANAYIDALAEQNSRVALTEASERRVFYEVQLAKEKDALADAEIALRDTQQSTGLVAPAGQAEGLIRSVSQLHAEILTHKAQLEAMSNFIAEDNPRFQMAKREVIALQAELNELERGNHIPGTPEVPAGQLPEAGLEYLRKYRDLKYHETLFEILARQYEAARLDEAKATPLVQVIDRAVPPERKSWPPRTILICSAAVLAGLVSGFWVLLRERPRAGLG